MRAGLAVLGVAVWIACSGPDRRADPRPRPRAIDAGSAIAESEPEPEPEGPHVPEDERAPEGSVCASSADCAAGEQCRGPAGCRGPWACGAARECLEESIAYCDCDGTTFYAAGGCPGRAYAHVGPCQDVGEAVAAGTELGIHDWDEPPTDDARACESSSDCAQGRICWGVPGCTTQWSCVRARGCRRDSAAYCGCDGATFRASSSCPGRPFVHRGECSEALARGELEVGEPDAGAAIASRRRVGAEPGARAPIARRDSDAGAPAIPIAPPQPRGCRSNRDCGRGHVCQGPPGCGEGIEWVCGPPERACVRDTQVFCDCEGEDFRASMFCPAQPYRHRGSCEIDRMLDLSGAAPR